MQTKPPCSGAARFGLAVAAAFCATSLFANSAAAQPRVSSEVLVAFRATAAPSTIRFALADAHATQVGTIPRLGVRVLVVGDGRVARALRALRRNHAVLFAEHNHIATPAEAFPNDPYFPVGSASLLGGEWGSFLTQAPQAWDLTTGSAQVVIAVVDSGIASAHPDLGPKIDPGYNVLARNADATDT